MDTKKHKTYRKAMNITRGMRVIIGEFDYRVAWCEICWHPCGQVNVHLENGLNLSYGPNDRVKVEV